MNALKKLGHAGLNHAGGVASFDAVARFITEDARQNQSAARTLAVVAGVVHCMDGFWRNLKQSGRVVPEGGVKNAVRWRVALAASLLGRARALGHFEVDSLAVDALESAMLGDWRLRADIGSAVRPTGDHVTAPMGLLDWFRAMDCLIGRGHAVPAGVWEVKAGNAYLHRPRTICRNTGADERPVRWDYADQ